MDVNEAIAARRSVRSYLPEPVETALIHSLIHAAVQAPTALNAQPWLFAVVQDRARLKRYSDKAKQRLLANLPRGQDHKALRYEAMLRDESFNIFYDAGTLIAIGSAQHSPYAEADCWLGAQNLMLAAHAAGLGTCCIGFSIDLLNSEEVKAELSFPAAAVIVAPIIVGHPAATPPVVARATPKIVSWLHEPGGGAAAQAERQRRYALEHPAGYLASRVAIPPAERVGHPPLRDEAGYGPFGLRQLNTGPHEFTLSTPLPVPLAERTEEGKHEPAPERGDSHE